MHLTNAEMADILHRASSLYMASNLPIDYGTGEKYTPVEMHMLKYIIEHPNKTLTEIAQEWDKTKASLSEMLKKLEAKGLIFHTPAPNQQKKMNYAPTPQGLALHKLHTAYDEAVFGTTLAPLRERFGEDELQQCFRMLAHYCEARQKKHYRSPK